MKFKKELYPKVALIKAAYNFTDKSYIHLDADNDYFYVSMEPKEKCLRVSEEEFLNEMLAQSVRHEIYLQTKSIRELLLARAMATSVIVDENLIDDIAEPCEEFSSEEIVKDWFATNEENKD